MAVFLFTENLWAGGELRLANNQYDLPPTPEIDTLIVAAKVIPQAADGTFPVPTIISTCCGH